MLKRNINMSIKLLLVVIFITLLVFILKVSDSGTVEEMSTPTPKPVQTLQKKVLKGAPKLYPEINYTVYYDRESTKELLAKIRGCIDELESIDKNNYTQKASKAISEELTRMKEIELRVASDLNYYIAWESEYYYATKVWEYFMQRGFSNEVTCAIIGNMMIETSGGTLDLKPNIYSPDGEYYGLCQWSKEYYPEAHGLSFEQQLDFLLETIAWEINTFGKNYKEGFTYKDFLAMTDLAEAALAFAKSYERCRPVSYEIRQEAALKAYEYFDLERPI